MNPRTTPARGKIAGRYSKAKQFAGVAAFVEELLDEGEDVVDAYVTLCVHSGIASSDVICGTRLGEYPAGEKHEDAVAMLATIDRSSSNYLKTLLQLKSRAAYSAESVSHDRALAAGRAMDNLLSRATTIRTGN